MFDMTTEWWQILIRVVLIYLFLLALVRITGKRHLGQLAPMDLLTVLLVSETVSPALTAQDVSLTAGTLAAATLFGLSLTVAVATHKWNLLERVVEGQPAILVQDGVIDPKVMASERITVQDLEVALRKHGITRIGTVVLGVVEPSGEITLVERSNE